MEPSWFSQYVENYFHDLIDDYGFTTVYQDYIQKFPGEHVVVLQSKIGRIKYYAREYDTDVRIDIAKGQSIRSDAGAQDLQESWIDIRVVLKEFGIMFEYISSHSMGNRIDIRYEIDWQLDRLAHELSPHWHKIFALLQYSDFKHRFLEYAKATRRQRILNKRTDKVELLVKTGFFIIMFGFMLGVFILDQYSRVLPTQTLKTLVLCTSLCFYYTLHMGDPSSSHSTG